MRRVETLAPGSAASLNFDHDLTALIRLAAMAHFRQGLIAAYRRDDHRADALIVNAEFFGGRIGQIHLPFAGESASVIDAHNNAAVILGVGDFGVG